MSDSDEHSSVSEGQVENSSTATLEDKSGRTVSTSESSFSLAKNETRRLARWKLFVFAILLSSTAVLGVLTYFVLSKEEQKDFESRVLDFAVEISELVHHEAQNVFLSTAALSTTITSFALATNATWPFLTIPHFESRGVHVNKVSNSLMTAFSPLVWNSSRAEWETYSVACQGWIEEGVNENIEIHQDFIEEGAFEAKPISSTIFSTKADGHHVYDDGWEVYLPVWQLAPAPHNNSVINYNLLSHSVFSRVYHGMLYTGQPVLSEVVDLNFFYGGSIRDDITHPHSFLLQPVYRDIAHNKSKEDIVGLIISILAWDKYFENVLPQDVLGVSIILEDTCNQTFTYIINGKSAVYVGPGDLHDDKYDDLVFRTEFAPLTHLSISTASEHCEFFLNIYPTSELEEMYKTNNPTIYTCAVLLITFVTSLAFILYNVFVQRRQDVVLSTAKQSNAIVSSVFPSYVRDRIMKDIEEQVKEEMKSKGLRRFSRAKQNLKVFLDNDVGSDNSVVPNSKPIADLFPNATIMFADIVEFSSWSSVREPSQVFQFLETVFRAFDEIAKRRRVFKVETVGDCYVAVAGLPEACSDHAVVMARFARNCSITLNDLSKTLEVTLGLDTGDLKLRIGLNSGPVTAGVLRGTNSRFQLFGDTVNTAARMESSGESNRIQLSQDTADLLCAAGKSHWIVPREDKVLVKGKGAIQTYWLTTKLHSDASSRSLVPSTSNEVIHKLQSRFNCSSSELFVNDDDDMGNIRKPAHLSDKHERLVCWNTDILSSLLKQIVARRNASGLVQSSKGDSPTRPMAIETLDGETVLDEVKEVVELPRFDAKAMRKQQDPDSITLNPNVTAQLHDFITTIATRYRDNPFHNFEHASHVTMSVVKLLSRIVAPDEFNDKEIGDNNNILISEDQLNRNLHHHSYGITSDPIAQFSVVMSSLIHDVDHPGVSNAQLVKENAEIAKSYKYKSVAEQNSVDVAWDLLMDKRFEDLRAVIYSTQEELNRFRQLVVNTVMATDIVDKELKELRNIRWNKAFERPENNVEQKETERHVVVNRKATIVIEHLIQASDVAHTMQHWHIYRKWNERFFREMLYAFESGRAEQDPCIFWYQGEIGFFDFYIIPLAKKLKECGVFGVSCDEYLNYAMSNRKEWEQKGEEIVEEMTKKFKGRGRFSHCQGVA